MKTKVFIQLSAQVGTRIKQLREERNMTQQDLADLCNFDKSDMSKIESGQANPTLKTLQVISQALEVKILELFNFE
jgi:transcriptional regulator with XRE-family HTH domain